jgi:hypothetical protein
MPDDNVVINKCRISINLVDVGICRHCTFSLPFCFVCNNGTLQCNYYMIASSEISALKCI